MPHASSVLREIHEVITKRISSQTAPVRKRDRVSTWIRSKAIDAKRMAKDADELQDMRRKLQNVIDAFTVRGPLKVYEVGAKALGCTRRYLPCFEASSLRWKVDVM
jgi:hypothetical protein